MVSGLGRLSIEMRSRLALWSLTDLAMRPIPGNLNSNADGNSDEAKLVMVVDEDEGERDHLKAMRWWCL